MYEDVQTLNMHKNKPEEKRLKAYHRSSRDSARTPVQWSDERNAGFSDEMPWLAVNENYPDINAKAEEADPDSILNFYRKAIALRKSLPVVRDGTYHEFWPLHSRLYTYERVLGPDRLLVICSFSDTPLRFRLPAPYRNHSGTLLLSNYPEEGSDGMLRPREGRVYRYCFD